MSTRLTLASACVAAVLVVATLRVAFAQPYARWEVADSARVQALQSSRAEFESAWNALLVAWMRARLAEADSAGRLARLARQVASAERPALGSRIGADALELDRHFSTAQRRLRVRAAVRESMAVAARARGEVEAADRLFRDALGQYRRLGERRREAWVLGSLGALGLNGGRYAEADSILGEALSARRGLGDERLIGNTLTDLGQAAIQLGRHPAAVRYLAEARTLRERAGSPAPLGTTLQLLATSLLATGQPDSAWPLFERALELTSLAGDSSRTLDAMVNYAAALTDHGRDPRAVALDLRALRNAEELGRTDRQGLIESNLGAMLRRTGRFTDALEHAVAAVELLEPGGPSPELVAALNELGRDWLDLGSPQRAGGPLRRALALADTLDDPILRGRVLVNRSWAAQVEDDADEAERFGLEALAAAAAAGDSALIHDAAVQLGDLARIGQRLAPAERWFVRAIESGGARTPEVHAGDLMNLAIVRQIGNRLDEAEEAHREALAIGRRVGALEIVSTALNNLGDVAERRGRFAEAFARYFESLALLDSLRSRQRSEAHAIAAFASRMDPYEAIVHLMGKLDPAFPDSGYAARAFLWAERSRARALLDQVAAAGGGAAMPRPLSIEEVQSRLPSRRLAMLYYSVGDSSTSLWVIRRDRWRHFRLPPRPQLRAAVARLVSSLREPPAGPDPMAEAASHELHRLLIGPAEPQLRGVDQLIVVPDGPLTRVPFEALQGAPVDGRAPQRKAYLVERFSVSYLPSASMLAILAPQGATRVLVAVGNPRFSDAAGPGTAGSSDPPPSGAASPQEIRLEPLPGTAREIAALAALARGMHVVTLSGDSATRSRLLSLPELPDAAIVHIATHGTANELEPERSGLWLAPEPGTTTPGFVSVADVMALRLRAEQVTLSACETGLGRLERGEGVIGLSRAFLAAGARSVLVSQWQVNDRSTANLIERFYRGLLSRNRSRTRALAEAKRALLRARATSAPFYWAPFVLIGDPGPLTSARRSGGSARGPRP